MQIHLCVCEFSRRLRNNWKWKAVGGQRNKIAKYFLQAAISFLVLCHHLMLGGGESPISESLVNVDSINFDLGLWPSAQNFLFS